MYPGWAEGEWDGVGEGHLPKGWFSSFQMEGAIRDAGGIYPHPIGSPARLPMIGAIYTSLSGLAAAQTKIVTAAHNTANANTDGFKKQRVVFQETQPQGVEATVERVNTPGPVFFKETEAGSLAVELSNVDLGEEAINLMLGKRLYEANLNVIKTQNQLLGSLLDIVE